MLPIIDPSAPSAAEAIKLQKDAAKLQYAAKIASDTSTSTIGSHFVITLSDPDKAAEAIAKFAIGIASRVIDAFSPEVK